MEGGIGGEGRVNMKGAQLWVNLSSGEPTPQTSRTVSSFRIFFKVGKSSLLLFHWKIWSQGRSRGGGCRGHAPSPSSSRYFGGKVNIKMIKMLGFLKRIKKIEWTKYLLVG